MKTTKTELVLTNTNLFAELEATPYDFIRRLTYGEYGAFIGGKVNVPELLRGLDPSRPLDEYEVTITIEVKKNAVWTPNVSWERRGTDE